MKPTIGISIGDPSGIGPEIVLKSISQPKLKGKCNFVVFGDIELLAWVNKKILHRSKLPSAVYENESRLSLPIRFGVVSAANGYCSGRYIEAAIHSAQRGNIDAIVTAPINKESFRLGGWGKRYTGHTEMFSALTGAKKTALMLISGPLRAIHVTSHIPLKDVSRKLTRENVFDTICLADIGLKKLGIRHPKIVVCGLNPHAGENGLLGGEEQRVIGPAIQLALRKGLKVVGPLPADTVWPSVRDGFYDVGVAMYHDQGQIPIKLHSFSNGKKGPLVHGINVTVGLPLIRTSVAHGTAFEIAGKGVASEQSLVDAIELALLMVKNKAKK